jgi:hypothetical protein
VIVSFLIYEICLIQHMKMIILVESITAPNRV